MGYNSHLKVMKKLFYSFFMLIAMSLTFIACEQTTPEPEPQPEPEPEPKVESNCYLYKAQQQMDNNGSALYILEFMTNELNVEEQSGSGDYLILMLYTEPQENSAPAAKTYNWAAFGEWYESRVECMVGGAVVNQESLAGTFVQIIEDGQMTDVAFSTGGTVEFKGNLEEATVIANLDFISGTIENQTYKKEFIYNGPIKLSQSASVAPQRAMSKALRLTNLSINY